MHKIIFKTLQHTQKYLLTSSKSYKTFSEINTKNPLLETSQFKILLNEKNPNLKVLDCSWYLPSDPRNGSKQFLEERIITSQFYDIDEIADKSTDLPHMLPTNEFFIEKMKKMDIRIDDIIVCYDKLGIFSSPRVWFNFKIYGAKNVYVLNGGYPKCLIENLPVEKGNNYVFFYLKKSIIARKYSADKDSFNYSKDSSRIKNLENMFELSEDIFKNKAKKNMIDVRSQGRYMGEEEEPRKTLKKGHVPGAENIFFKNFLTADGTYKTKEDILETFQNAGNLIIYKRNKH